MQRDLKSDFMEWSHRRAERQERIRRLDTDLDWRTWFRHRFAAYWYGLLVLFVDVAVIATILSLVPPPPGPGTYAVAIAFVVPVGYLEWEAYRILWPGEDEILERLERKAAVTRVRGFSPEGPPRRESRDAPPSSDSKQGPPET